MSTSSNPRAFRPLHPRASPDRTISLKTLSTPATKHEQPPAARTALSFIRKSAAPAPTSPSAKRHSSTISLGTIFPRRKSLQTTAIATRRQSLWMNIAKNAPATHDTPAAMLPLGRAQSSLIRKKILRLLLVFSYLLSISLLAIALATFYGFFWSGYSTPHSTTTPDTRVTTHANETSREVLERR